MRVLHLIESIHGPPSGTSLSLLADLIRADGAGAHRVGAIGPAELADRLRSMGLEPSWHLPVARSQGGLAALRLWNQLRREGPTDVLHAWSPRGAVLAGLMGRWVRRAGRPLATLSHLPQPTLHPGWRWLMRRVPCPVLTLSPEAGDELRAAGVGSTGLHPVGPGIDTGRIVEGGRPDLRQQWGVEDEETPIVAAVGDPPEAVDAMTATLSVGMVRETGRAVRLVISPRAAGVGRAERVCLESGRDDLLVISSAADEPWRSLPAVDMVLAMNGGLSTVWGMAAGRPIVGPNEPGLRHFVTDRHNALLGPPGKAGEMARRLIQLMEDPARAGQLAEQARRDAAERYDPADYAERMRAVYRAIHENRPLPEAAGPAPACGNSDQSAPSCDREDAKPHGAWGERVAAGSAGPNREG